MTILLPLLGAAFVGLAVVWPLAFFGYRYYTELVAQETAKHAHSGGH